MNEFAVNEKLFDEPSWFAISTFVMLLNTRKLYVYVGTPPVSYVAMVMVCPLSYVVATLGDIVGVDNAAFTVIVPELTEFAVVPPPTPAESVTSTFAL